MNILNPALTARAFLFFAYPTYMSGDKVWINTDNGTVVDGFSGATPLADLAANIPVDMSLIGSFFLGNIPGSIGETSTFAILIGAVILIFTGIGSWRTMLSVFMHKQNCYLKFGTSGNLTKTYTTSGIYQQNCVLTHMI